MNSARVRATFVLFFLMLISLAFINPVYANPDELVVSTNRRSYSLGATINIHGTLTLGGNPVTNGLVAVHVVDLQGNLRLIRVVPTGTPPPPWKVRIVEFLSCDFQGNPKNSFNRGTLAYFKVTVESLDAVLERQVTIAFNLFDWVGVSIAVAYACFPLAPGKQVTYLTSMPIPNDAFVGTAIGCVSALTKWPKDGGHPYCPEMRVNFTITGGTSQTTAPTLASTSPPGSFNLSFKLPSTAVLGKYAVYTSARYNAWANTTFTYMWLRTDINTDGKVNIIDVSMAATAFGSKIGAPTYNSLADINEDKIINILDITRIALDYGKSRA